MFDLQQRPYEIGPADGDHAGRAPSRPPEFFVDWQLEPAATAALTVVRDATENPGGGRRPGLAST